jgi:poly(3-hydroxybutyrate) depolymerase
MMSGASGTTLMFNGQSVQTWAGTKKSTGAPLLFYWHGTGSSSTEASLIMSAQVSEITAAGGVVASFASSTGTGNTLISGTAIFSSDDFKTADQVLACASQELNIDPRRIYTAGCSAGGLTAGAMLYMRSSYIAASMPNSGGLVVAGLMMDNPSHIGSLITTHGGSSDYVGVMFSQTSATEDMDVASKAASSMPPGGYVVDCNHMGGHCGAPANDIAAQWQFCKDHPFGVSPNPYSGGLPSSFPTYCTVIK